MSDFVSAFQQGLKDQLPQKPSDLLNFTPVGALNAGREAVGAQGLSSKQRAVLGLGAALGVAGLVGARAHQNWRAGAYEGFTKFGEEGMLALGPRRGPEWVTPRLPHEYRPVDLRSQILLNARDFDHMADLTGTHAPNLLQTQRRAGIFQHLGDRLTSETEIHRGRDPLAATTYEVAKLDALASRGLLSADLQSTYDALRSSPDALYAPGGGLTEAGKRLTDFTVRWSDHTADFDSATLALPPGRRWLGVEMTPRGPRASVVHDDLVFPAKDTPEVLNDRLKHFDYDAAVPDMVRNLLFIKGYLTTPNEIGKGMRWYEEAHQLAKTMVRSADDQGHKLPLESAAAIVSALSPQTSWLTNARGALEFVKSGGEMTNYTDEYGSLLSKTLDKARRIWNGEDPAVLMTTDKTRNFYKNIADPKANYDAVIDRHSIEAALGYRTFTGDHIIFDAGENAQRAYAAVAEAHRIAANIEGLMAHQVQAITWLPVQQSKLGFSPDVLGEGEGAIRKRSAVGLGGRTPFNIPGNRIKDYLEGRSADGIVSLALRAQGDDLGPVPTELPFAKRRANGEGTVRIGDLRPGLIEVLEPMNGGSTVVGPATEEVVQSVRTLAPLRAEGDRKLVRYVPVAARQVEDVGARLAELVPATSERPAGFVADVHGETSHPGLVPGNHIVVLGPLDSQERWAAGLRAAIGGEGLQADVVDMHPVKRTETGFGMAKLGPNDIAEWTPRDLEREMSRRQWVGISAHTTQHNAEAHATLRSTLESRGYKPIEVDGHYGGHEKSFIVFGMPNDEAAALGRSYKQESIVSSSAGLVYTSGENRGKVTPSTGQVTSASRASDFYSEMQVGKRRMKWQLGLDFDQGEVPAPADLNLALRPAATDHGAVWIDLGANPGSADVQHAWNLVERHARDAKIELRPQAYLHGDIAPEGTAPAREYLEGDKNRQLAYRTRHNRLDDPNAIIVHLPAAEAAELPDAPHPVVHGERRKVQWQEQPDGSLIANGELRVTAPGDVQVFASSALKAKVDGKAVRTFALHLSTDDLPELALGEGATSRLTSNGADPARIVQGRVVGDRVLLEAPPSPADGTRANSNLGVIAEKLLARFGNRAAVEVKEQPWRVA